MAKFTNWKWLLFAPMILGAAVMFLIGSTMPKRYRATALIQVVPAVVPDSYVKATLTTPVEDRLQSIAANTLSRTRLEAIIRDFDLYAKERGSAAVPEDVVQRMRGDIMVQVNRGDSFRVSYIGGDPATVLKVTERLAARFIDEGVRDRSALAEGTNQFLDAQLEDIRRRLIVSLDKFERARGSNVSRAELEVQSLELDQLRSMYRSLLTKKEESKIAANMERRQIGEQFKLIEAARLPERPETPNRRGMTIGGSVIGFGVGLLLLLIAAVRRKAD